MCGLSPFEVWAAPFDVMFDLVSAKAAMMNEAQPATAAPAARHEDPVHTPGMSKLIEIFGF